MSDAGSTMTDKVIEKMEKRISKEYKQAAKEVDKKLKAYMKSFAEKEKDQLKKLKAGEITQQEFNTWKATQMLTGKRWEAMRDSLTQDMLNANEIARSTIQGHMADVYALNRNYAAYEIEVGANIDTSWTLYNRRAAEDLLRDNERLLPMPKKGGKAWQAMMNKDTRWNQQKIHSSMLQGILQGDGAAEMADRLQTVVGMNFNSAIRNARTMSTYVQAQGRQDTYDDLQKQGIELVTVWEATLDDRTRTTHRWLHGTERDPETGKFANGLECPGDPAGDPEEVYNCRCTIRSSVKGFEHDVPKWSPKMGDETFEQWLGDHNPFEKAPAVVPVTDPSAEVEKYFKQFQSIKGISDDQRRGMAEKIANCGNEDAKAFFFKYADQLEAKDSSYSGGAHFASWKGGIFFNQEEDGKGDNLHAPFQVAFHEFGHMLDWLGNGKDDWQYLSATEIDGTTLRKLIRKDYRKMMKDMECDDKYDFIALLKADYAKPNGGHHKEFGNVSDILEFCTGIRYPLGVGHGSSYHKRKGATETEFFAEVLDSAIANPEAYARMQEFFPSAVDWVWKAVKTVL